MTENEVRTNLIESKDWQKTANELRMQREHIEEEMIGQTIDVELKTRLEQEAEGMMTTVSKLVKDLKLQDKERGLYTLAPAKTKDKVVYPEPYSGDTGVNVFKFANDVKDAIAADQVRKSDQIKTLRKFLKGEAKQVIGEHYTDLEKALAALTKAFGSPTLIWKGLFEELKKGLGNYDNWGKKKTGNRLTAICKTEDFLRHAISLAEKYTQLASDIYTIKTVSDIMMILPTLYQDKWVDEIDDEEESYEVKIKTLLDVLESLKKKL